MDAPTRPVLRVQTLPDLIALVPVVLGFEPAESLVVVAVDGRRAGFHARTDLSVSTDPELLPGLLAQLSAAVRIQQSTRVGVLAFTEVVDGDQVSTVDGVLGAVADRLTADGVTVVEVLRVSDGRYWSLHCTSQLCCPDEGTPYDTAATQLRAEATLMGIGVAPDRGALMARLAPVTSERAKSMHRATRAAEQEVVAALGLRSRRSLRRPPRRAVRAAVGLGAARLDRVLNRALTAAAAGDTDAGLSDADAAALAVWCSITCFRDLAWLRMARLGARNDFVVWSAVSRLVVPPYEPAVLCLAGFAAWLSGDGASAGCAIARAQAADADYSMAVLLDDALARCVPPDVWEPIPRDLAIRPAAGDDLTSPDW